VRTGWVAVGVLLGAPGVHVATASGAFPEAVGETSSAMPEGGPWVAIATAELSPVCWPVSRDDQGSESLNTRTAARTSRMIARSAMGWRPESFHLSGVGGSRSSSLSGRLISDSPKRGHPAYFPEMQKADCRSGFTGSGGNQRKHRWEPVAKTQEVDGSLASPRCGHEQAALMLLIGSDTAPPEDTRSRRTVTCLRVVKRDYHLILLGSSFPVNRAD
jgi:hypothetical protein